MYPNAWLLKFLKPFLFPPNYIQRIWNTFQSIHLNYIWWTTFLFDFSMLVPMGSIKWNIAFIGDQSISVLNLMLQTRQMNSEWMPVLPLWYALSENAPWLIFPSNKLKWHLFWPPLASDWTNMVLVIVSGVGNIVHFRTEALTWYKLDLVEQFG